MSFMDQTKQHRFTSAALEAAAKARAAKRETPDRFGVPELFIVKADDHAFTWELRRFGGLLLQRGSDSFASQALARAGGEMALAALCAMPDQPTFKRGLRRKEGDGTD